jgi:hypothetical protein
MKHAVSLMILCLLGIFTYAQAPTIQWQKSIGGSNSEAANSIIQTTDGGYIIAGYSFSNDGDVSGHHGDSTTSDCWIAKLNSVGAIQWEQSYGGAGNEVATSIIQTSDGGYIFTGLSDSTSDEVTGNHGGYDIWVVKIDSVGNMQWEQSYGGSSDEGGVTIAQTTDGGYIIGGNTTSNNGDITFNHGDGDYWLVKISSTGAIQWQNTYGGSYNDWGYYAIQTGDGGYMIGGISESIDGEVTGNHGSVDYWVVKTDTAGNLQWEQSYGGAGYDRLGSIIQTTDGGYFMTGLSDSTSDEVTGNHGSYDFWVVKIFANGSIQWEQSYGGTNYDAAGISVQTSDGGYIVSGVSSSVNDEVTGHHGDTSTTDYWVIKMDTLGNIQWKQSYGGSDNDQLYSIIQTTDGGYTMAGSSFSNDGDVTGHHDDSTTSDCWIVKINEYATGINTVIGQANAHIYPNPTSDKFVLEVSSNFIGGQYKLTDITGREIITGKIQNEISQYSLTDLSAGLYVLEINNSNKQVFKIVKQ